ncbi:MAG: glutamine-hydrolyzing carbamoyl-phosphate synthase small subunit [Planctomycetes bacterium]|nr:glutamine-hydrolyzing carbamoyl-phosphate synthase small subunit [Planctomycetota bacterium]
MRPCILALEDGTVLHGEGFGASGTSVGEVVFNTAMTGYQEVLTDPSYCGQIVAMTYPQIGNYGVNDADVESSRPQVAGFVVRELARSPSNHRATRTLDEYLARSGVVGIQGVDTRALTRRLRVEGAMRGVISTEITDPLEGVGAARAAQSMVGADLVSKVAPREGCPWLDGLSTAFELARPAAEVRRRVVAIDCGMKRQILRHLVDEGCDVQIVPPTTSAGAIVDFKPDGVFVSNGPGDPAAVTYAVSLLRSLIGRLPIFGICLGHQLLGLALGAETYKLKFGHRGANQPVQNVATRRVEITSQNHGFAIDVGSLERAGGVPTHTNLNDGTLEGFVHPDRALLAVQYHPEASPGPHDATYLFDCFAAMMSTGRAPSAQQMAEAQAALQHRRWNGPQAASRSPECSQ